MHHFHYLRGKLMCEGVSVESLAKKYGTPLYVYSERTLLDNFHALDTALAPLNHLICYALKANSNGAILRALARAGSGFDIVSAGELQRVLAAGGDASKCVFAGVGKTADEIAYALDQGIYSLNVESEAELLRINEVAGRQHRRAPISIRVNPNVDARTHAKITTGTYENKFGIAFEKVEGLYAKAASLRHIAPRGVQMHIGSQLTQTKPFAEAVRKVAPLARRLAEKYGLEFFSIGGGVGIIYEDALASGDPAWWNRPGARALITPAKYAETIVPLLRDLPLRLLIEPGRFIVGNSGILVSKIEYVKRTGKKNFLIVDAAMTELIRPALYDSYHEIVPVTQKRGSAIPSDVVGPVCESGDCFCKDRPLPKLQAGDMIALMSAGAYGSVMSSNYNSRPLAAEALVHGRNAALVREREPVHRIWDLERIPPWLK